MGSIAVLRHAVIAVASVAAIGLFPACGGSDGTDTPPEPQSLRPASAGQALEGKRVSGRDEALQLVARGVVAPLYGSELAHAVLARAFEVRANAHGALPAVSPGDGWLLALDTLVPVAGATLEGSVAIDIEAANHAEDLILRDEVGFVRAVLHFDHVGLGTAGHIDGAIVLEVSRTATGAGPARRSQADRLSVADGSRTLHWSYLDIQVDAQQAIQRLNVVSATPIDGSDAVWLDVTSSAPDRITAASHGAKLSSGRYIASGVIGFLKARLTLEVATGGGWTIEVDNDKDDRVDFVVQASAQEARALMLGL
jgi:hypothetical protein